MYECIEGETLGHFDKEMEEKVVEYIFKLQKINQGNLINKMDKERINLCRNIVLNDFV